MKVRYCVLTYLLLLSASSVAHSQENQRLNKFLKEIMYSVSKDKILKDSLKKNKWVFNFPKKNGDTLVSYVVSDFKKEIRSLKKDCSEMGKGGEIGTEFEVKTYIKGKIVSILEKVYFDCNMPSPAHYENTYNYISNDNHIYKITFKKDNSGLNKIVDSIVHAHFEKECLEGVTIGGEFDLFIDNGLFICNPLHTKFCDENIEIKNGVEYLEFKKMD